MADDINNVPIDVGDIVVVGRACMGNPFGSRAVCCETYERLLADGPCGVMLLFPNGMYDGFSPKELALWEVQKIDHVPIAGYDFRDVIQLAEDFRKGCFQEAFDAT